MTPVMGTINAVALSKDDRLFEISELLAAGMHRLRGKSSGLVAPGTESFVDVPLQRSGHAPSKTRRRTRA